ncbi:MerR family transcriptional regulator [Nocardioides sp. CPCC 205120]|uniref:MerR family transcriptional regulator n=1 Tax=Nocardioides sp. CPCC 205120 TaxID=3406462 RepID=UPI003B503FF4
MARRTTGVFAISVAADMVSMQVQNLRVYERRGLLEPDRTPGGTRLYSEADIDRLHRIRTLLEEGLNLVGIGRVLALEAEVERLRGEVARLRRRRGEDQPRQT